MTGKGLGLDFVNAGLDFARHHFAPLIFRLYVMTYNERAIRVYERAGFQHGAIFVVRNAEGDHEFMEMHRPV